MGTPFLLSSQSEWNAAAIRMGSANRVAIDTESNSFFRYPEQVCLIQLWAAGETVLLDPLAVKDLAALGKILADPKVEKVFHGCDYDLRTMDRDFNFRVHNLFDTGVAIRLLEPETMSLDRALLAYAGVTVKKSPKIQRSDWSRRPLSPEALEYASADAAHLSKLRDALQSLLEKKGRETWAKEEFSLLEEIRYEAPEPPEIACFGTKGTFDLEAKALAVFRELYLLRDAEARRVGLPPFKVAGNEWMLELARQPGRNPFSVRGVNPRWLEDAQGKVREALRKGMAAEPLNHPSRQKRSRNPWSEEASARWGAVHAARGKMAAELNLGVATLWPTKGLQALALDPAIADREIAGKSEYGVRRWQQGVFGPTLRSTLLS